MAPPTKNPTQELSSTGSSSRSQSGKGLPIQDQFLEVSSKVVDQVFAWRMPILVGIAGIFAVAGAVTLWNSHQAKLNEQAAAEIFKATSELPDGSDPLGQLGIDLGDVARPTEEVQERNQQLADAAASLEKIAKTYSNVQAGTLAELERGMLLQRAARPDEAAKAYQQALDLGPSEPLFKFRALNGLANAERAQRKFSQSIQAYQKIVNELDGIWRQLALIEVGRTYEMQQDYKSATGAYEQFLKEFPDASQAADIEARLAVAKAGGPAIARPSVPEPGFSEGSPSNSDAGSVAPNTARDEGETK